MSSDVRTITIKPGDPCPFCGQTEPHDIGIGFDHRGGPRCEPGESRAAHDEVVRALLFGMRAAAECEDIAGVRAEIERLEDTLFRG